MKAKQRDPAERPLDLDALKDQIARLTSILAPSPPEDRPSYTIAEAAEILGRAVFTVREWCRLGQCNAYKLTGWRSGPYERWRISGEEVERLKEEGLLPADAGRNRGRSGRA